MTDLFAYVKASVPSPEAAIRYGFTPDRSGKIRCPFHGEKTPSLQLYPGSRGWYCFGCGTGGSVIDFAMRLFGMSAKEAAEKLADDFRLDIPQTGERAQLTHWPQRPRNVRSEFEAWREHMAQHIADALHVINAAMRRDPDTWTEAETEGVTRYREALEYARDKIESRNMADMMEVFRDRKGVDWICNRILTPTKTKSSAA